MRNQNPPLLIIIITFLALLFSVTIATTTTVAVAEEEQIILNPNNIKELVAFGETDKPWYPENYPPEYLFDNLINSYSFWTQQGNAGFNLELKEKLDKSVCSIELGVLQPQNTPFSLAVNEKVVTGTLNNEKIIIKIGSSNNDNCIPNVTKLSMNFTPIDRIFWTTLSEIKLFSDKTQPPPPVVVPGNSTKFIIDNSNVTMDLNDSQVTIKIGNNAKVNTILEEKQQQVKQPTTPIGTPLPPPAADDKDKNNDDDDKEDKKDQKEEDDKK